MLEIIRSLLKQWINDIDTGASVISENEQFQILNLAQQVFRKEVSKTEAADLLGVCTSTIDNYVKKNLIPKGQKRPGFNELFWNKADLLKFKQQNENRN